MTVADRVMRCRLIEKMEEYPDYSEKLGLEDHSKIMGARSDGPVRGETARSDGPVRGETARNDGLMRGETAGSEGPMRSMQDEAEGNMEPTVERRRILYEENGVQVQGYGPG